MLRAVFGRKPGRGRAGPATFRLFYASDLHGCDRAWRKFLAAARVYEADALVMGGDLTGKAIVPLVRRDAGGFEALLDGGRILRTPEAATGYEDAVSTNGFYPYRCDRTEYERMHEEPAYLDDVFRRLALERLRQWVELAEERLAGSGVRVYVMPGNDDDVAMDEALVPGDVVVPCDGDWADVGPYRMLSIPWANPTPWHTPRELPEPELAALIEDAVGEQAGEDTIFNFHVPPYDSGLDLGPAVRADLTVEKEAGDTKRVPIGSTSVRAAIERYQPLLALHGHVHESPGTVRLGRTLCLNPGSRYNEGVLDGAIVALAGPDIVSHQLVAG